MPLVSRELVGSGVRAASGFVGQPTAAAFATRSE